MPKTYDLLATLGTKTKAHRGLLLGQVDLFIDAPIQAGWDVTVKECATGVIVTREEIAQR